MRSMASRVSQIIIELTRHDTENHIDLSPYRLFLDNRNCSNQSTERTSSGAPDTACECQIKQDGQANT